MQEEEEEGPNREKQKTKKKKKKKPVDPVFSHEIDRERAVQSYQRRDAMARMFLIFFKKERKTKKKKKNRSHRLANRLQI